MDGDTLESGYGSIASSLNLQCHLVVNDVQIVNNYLLEELGEAPPEIRMHTPRKLRVGKFDLYLYISIGNLQPESMQ